jgi:flagellar assembly protein FliH
MILLSRLIKSQRTNSTPSEKKVISIKMLNIPEFVLPGEQHEGHYSYEIIENAKAEADQILQQAKAEAQFHYENMENERIAWEQEKLVQADIAREKGYLDGFEEGRGLGKAEYENKITLATQVIQSSKQDYDAYMQSSEKTILDLSLKVAEKILGTRISESEEDYLSFVKRALKEAKDYLEVQIHVNPLHYNLILARKEELQQVFPRETKIFIYPDSEVAESGLVIESEHGRIDAGIDTQLSEIQLKLTEILESEIN